MTLPLALDGITSTNDVQNYIQRHLSPGILQHIKTVPQMNRLMKTQGINLDNDQLIAFGGVLQRYKTSGAVNAKDAQVILDIIEDIRNSQPRTNVKREARE